MNEEFSAHTGPWVNVNRAKIFDFYFGEKHTVQWWVGLLLRLRRTAQEPNYFQQRWESNLELEFSKYFALEGTLSRAKKLMKAMEVVELIEASPGEREKRLKANKGASKLWGELKKQGEKIQGSLGDGRLTWDSFYVSALQYLSNAQVSKGDRAEPTEPEVRKLALRWRAWKDLASRKENQTEAFAKLLFNPGTPDDPLEIMVQKEITELREHYQPVWSRLAHRYRLKPVFGRKKSRRGAAVLPSSTTKRKRRRREK